MNRSRTSKSSAVASSLSVQTLLLLPLIVVVLVVSPETGRAAAPYNDRRHGGTGDRYSPAAAPPGPGNYYNRVSHPVPPATTGQTTLIRRHSQHHQQLRQSAEGESASRSNRRTVNGGSVSGGVPTLQSVVDDRCDPICELQGSVLRLVGTQLDYGRGLHAVYDMVETLRKDVTQLRSRLDCNDVAGGRRTNAAQGDSASTLATSDPVTSSLAHNLTSAVERHAQRLSGLDRRSRRLQRAVKDVAGDVTKMAAVAEKLESTSKQCAAFVEQLAAKQKDININFLRKLSVLEKTIETKLAYGQQIGHHQQQQQLMQEQALLQRDSPAGMTSSPRYAGSSCPMGYVRHATSCYRFVNQTKNWIEAEKHCQMTHQDSHLVSIETRAELDMIIAYRAHNNACWSSRYIWTGGNDMASEGHWTWVGTGRTVGADSGFTDWRPGQPDNHNGDQHCIYARADGSDTYHQIQQNRSFYGPTGHQTASSSGTGTWDDWHCHAARLNFVCELILQH